MFWGMKLTAFQLRPGERLAQRLISWRPDLEKDAALEAVSQLASGVFADHEVLGFELAAKLWSNWMEPLARKYQDVLARAAQEPGNHVVVLPTGAGKTLISFEVIFAALLRHPEKIVASPSLQDTGRHPYAQIAATYASAPRFARPKLLGLTASPAETKEQTMRLLEQLQAKLIQIKDVHLRHELSEVVPKAKLLTREVPCRREFCDFIREAEGQLRQLQRQLSQPPEADAFRAVTHRLKQIKDLSARVRCLCWGETANIMGLEMPAVDGSLSQAWEKLRCSGAELSPFFESLLELLGLHIHAAPVHQFRCIVFVETRSAATTMTQMLKFVAGSEHAFAWISPVCLLGHCKTDAESMTMAQQNEILRNFRDGNWLGV
eukprot:s132_g33.t1